MCGLLLLLVSYAGITLPYGLRPAVSDDKRIWILLAVLVFVWIRSIPSVVAGVTTRGPVLVITDSGVERPGYWMLEWSDIKQIRFSPGSLKIIPAHKSQERVDLFYTQFGFSEIANAAQFLKSVAPSRLSEMI